MINANNVMIDLSSADERILQSLISLYTTTEGTQPMAREFGLKNDYLGYPIEIAKNMYALEVMEKTEKYIPEYEVREVTFSADNEGKLNPVIHLTKGSEIDED